MLEKVARLEYSPLRKELEAQTDIAKKKFQTLDKIYETDETINKKPALKNYGKSDLIYDSIYSFYNYYRDIKKFDNFL